MSPMRRELYPADWEAISAAIRRRAGNCCEGSPAYPNCRAANGEPHPVTGSRVVLTTAHLDHDQQNSDPGNLRAWCQRCHLFYDLDHHMADRKRTLAERKAVGQRDLFAEEA